MLRHRLTFGPLIIVILLALFWLDSWLDSYYLPESIADLIGRNTLPSGFLLFLLCTAILPLAALELTRILRANGINESGGLTIIAAELGLFVHYFIPQSMDGAQSVALVGTALVAMFVVSLVIYSRGQNVEGVVAAAGGTMFAMIYLGLMLGFYLSLRRWESTWLIMAVIAITKACDSGAYFTGRFCGKHKLIPWLSPKKTWEGLAGGLITAVIFALLLCWWGQSIGQDGQVEYLDGKFHNFAFPWWKAIAAGLLFGIVGHAGDLTASLFKRDAGIKDSSNLLPGFGGVLDILDSPLLVAPVAYWLLSSS